MSKKNKSGVKSNANNPKPFEPKTFKLTSSETVLSDDYPIHCMYVYICDSVFTRYAGLDSITVSDWKRQKGYKEIRRCDLFAHEGARLGDRVVAE